jgi:sialic acid synthase SpsE
VDIPLIEYTTSKGKPMILSTGMGTIDEIQDAIDACHRVGNEQIILLKCCSQYPSLWEDMRLGNIPDMKERFKVPIGLSDHSTGSLGAVVGVTLGASVVEKHIKLDNVTSADSKFSMTADEFAQMVKDIRTTKVIAQGPDYSLTHGEQTSMIFRRSVFAVKDIEVGDIFTTDNLRIIRPGYGIKPKYLKDLIGKKCKCTIHYGDPISDEMKG